jgi:hypothetical protein
MCKEQDQSTELLHVVSGCYCPTHLVVESGPSEDHGDSVCPLRLVAPLASAVVPQMKSRGKAHQTIGKLSPHLQ